MYLHPNDPDNTGTTDSPIAFDALQDALEAFRCESRNYPYEGESFTDLVQVTDCPRGCYADDESEGEHCDHGYLSALAMLGDEQRRQAIELVKEGR